MLDLLVSGWMWSNDPLGGLCENRVGIPFSSLCMGEVIGEVCLVHRRALPNVYGSREVGVSTSFSNHQIREQLRHLQVRAPGDGPFLHKFATRVLPAGVPDDLHRPETVGGILQSIAGESRC